MERVRSFGKNVVENIIDVFYKIRVPFLLFLVYSFLGWLFEVGVFFVKEHQFINRGFLIGPCCSIYGYGCLMISYGLKNYRKSAIKLFFVSVIVCSVFEYVVSYVMEVLFGGRWWDYAQNSYQLNGRVWLVTSLLFGFLVCMITYYLRPFLLNIINRIPKNILNIVAGVLLFIYISDTLISFTAVVNLGDELSTFDIDVTKQVSEQIFGTIKTILNIH